ATTAPDSAAMAKLASFVMDYTITAKVTGDQGGDFKVTGNGPFSVDTSKISAGSGDPTAALGAITMANTMQASANGNGQSMAGNFEFRIVDGNLYFKGDKATQDKWMYLSLAKTITAAMSNPMFGSMMSGGGGSTSGNPAAAMMSDPEVM